MIQQQNWEDEIRILITDEQNCGSVQVSIPLYNSDIYCKADALIYALYVDSVCREQCIGNKLLKLAEQQAKLRGVQIIALKVDNDCDNFVLNWYLRNGYRFFSKNDNLLIKELK